MLDHPHSGSASAVDLVWDGNYRGTALAPSGRRLRVGTGGDWPPDMLLALACTASVMETFLHLAEDARLELLAYVSAGAIERRHDGSPSIVISPCVMVGSVPGVATAEALLARAATDAPAASWLEVPLVLRAHVHPPSPTRPHGATRTVDQPRRPVGQRPAARPSHGHEC